MNQQTNQFIAKDQLPIFYYKWLPADKSEINGVIQIAHGLAEQAQRYASFARIMTNAGYIVYANDHRGHGQTAGSLEKVGYFEDAPFWDAALSDMHQLTQIIQKENIGLPIFLFGHSMGSLLSRQYITQWGNRLSGAILCATAGDPGLLGKIGGLVAKTIGLFYGKKVRSPFLTKLSFGKYNDAFTPNRTEFDWLSRDEAEVDKYVADPYCGVPFTTGFWIDFLKGIGYINSNAAYQKTPKALPILLIAGDKDPVGDMGKGVRAVHRLYQQMAIKDLTCTIYPSARHELLNETNRVEIIGNILKWMEDRV